MNLKFSNLGLAKLWYALSTHKDCNEAKRETYLKCSWDHLFLAAEAGEI